MFRSLKSLFSSPHEEPITREVHPYEKTVIFELNSWCFGLEQLGEKILPGVVHKIVKEFAPLSNESINHVYAPNLLEIAQRLSVSSGGVVSEKEIAFAFLANLPQPQDLSREEKEIFTLVVLPVERKFGKAVKRIQERFQLENQRS